MFRIEYDILNIDIGASEVNKDSLRYSLFLGSAFFKDGTNEIIMDWDWIPPLDFAFSLQQINKRLAQTAEIRMEFEFTESDAKLIFKKNRNVIEISTTFSDCVLTVDKHEFATEVNRIYKQIVAEIIISNKEIMNNKDFFRYMNESGEG